MTKIVLVGAGSMQFGAGMLGDIFQSRVLEDAEIVLNDINGAAVERTRKMAQEYIEGRSLCQKVVVEHNLGVALKDAQFVVVSIEVGDRFAHWDMDWKIPQQYGIRQVFGENGGPGGLFHSLRIIPPILEICGKVMEYAPGATVFNFSNPMSRICTTVHRKYPELRFAGMCHEIASLERHLAPMLGVERSEIQYRAGGLNHFSVMTDVTYVRTGECAYGDVRERAPGYFGKMAGYSEFLRASRRSGTSIETEGWMEIDSGQIGDVRDWSDRWLFRDILERFGVLPITYDSHFGEYIGWAWDCADHQGILDFHTYYRRHLGAAVPEIKEELRERVVPIIEALLTGTSYEEPAVNISNAGFIRNLPEWISVEVPAMVGEGGIAGIAVDVPSGILGLLSNQIGVHDLTAEAVLNRSRDLVVQACLVDPIVTVSKTVPAMVDHMIAEHSPWLDYLE